MSLGAAVSLIEIDYGGPGGIVFPSLFAPSLPPPPQGGGAQLPGATRLAASRIFPFSAESAPRAGLRPIHESTPAFLHLGGEGEDICHGHLPSPPPPSLETMRRSIKERRVVRLWCGNGEG